MAYMTPTKVCRTCGVEKPRSCFLIGSQRVRATVGPNCGPCRRTANRRTYANRREAHLAGCRARYQVRVSTGEGRALHRVRGRAIYARLRAQTIAAYGGKCACCGERTSEFLTVDHIRNNGAAHRRSGMRGPKFYRWLRNAGWPKDDFRLLCMNCNFARGAHGMCPHEIAALAIEYAVDMEARRD